MKTSLGERKYVGESYTLHLREGNGASVRTESVQKVEQIPFGQSVYDLEVEGPENFLLTKGYFIHNSRDPTNKWDTPHIRGPGALRYNFKIVLYMDPSKSKKTPNFKKLWVTRFFNVEGWSKFSPLELTDQGYVDLTIDDIAKRIKRARRKMQAGEPEEAPEGELGPSEKEEEEEET